MAFIMTAGHDRLTANLYDRFNQMLSRGLLSAEVVATCKLKMELQTEGEHAVIALRLNRTPDEMTFAALRNGLAAVIYQFVREVVAADYLEERLLLGYGDLLLTEKEQVGSILKREMGKYWEYARANHVLAALPELLSDYLGESSYLNIQGFLRFRLPEYFPLLGKTLDRAVERYRVEKEYDAFIDLIQAFIQTQKSKINVVHVVWGKQHRFRLLDENHLPLEQDFWQQGEGVAMEGAYDDVLISSLLYLLPEKIILHTGCQMKAPKIALTLQKIFSGRAMLCAGCTLCKETAQQFQK